MLKYLVEITGMSFRYTGIFASQGRLLDWISCRPSFVILSVFCHCMLIWAKVCLCYADGSIEPTIPDPEQEGGAKSNGTVPHFCGNPDMWYEKSRNSQFLDGRVLSPTGRDKLRYFLSDLWSLSIHLRLLNSLFQFTLFSTLKTCWLRISTSLVEASQWTVWY